MKPSFSGHHSASSGLSTSATFTDDKRICSILLTGARVESLPSDSNPAPDGKVFEIEVGFTTEKKAKVKVEARGARLLAGVHSWAHALIWANGQRLPLAPENADPLDSTFYTAAISTAQPGEPLRISVSLIAQRDLGEAASQASFELDSLDITVE